MADIWAKTNDLVEFPSHKFFNELMSIKKQFAGTFVTQVLVLVMGIISGVLITRYLGAEGKGVYTIVFANVQLAMLIFSFNCAGATIYFVSNKEIEYGKLLGGVIQYLILGLFLFGALIWLSFQFGFSGLLLPEKYQTTDLIALVFLIYFFGVLIFFFIGLLRGEKKFNIVNGVNIIITICNLVSFSLLIFFFNDITLYEKVLYIFLVVLLLPIINLSLLVFQYYRKSSFKFKPKFNLDKKQWYLLLGFAGTGYLGQIFSFLNYRIDIWIVDSYSGLVELGIYSVAIGVSRLFLMGSETVASVLMPFLNSQTDTKQRHNTFSLYTRVIFTFTLLAVIALGFVADFLVPFVYGADFINSVLPLKILLIGCLFTCLAKFFSVYSVITGNIKLNLYSIQFAFVVTIVLDFLLIPKYGIIGASIANTCAAIILFLSLFISQYFKKIVPIENYFIMRRADVGLVKNVIKSSTAKFL